LASHGSAPPLPLAPLAFRRERLADRAAGNATAAAAATALATTASPALGGRLLGSAAGALAAELIAPSGSVFDAWGDAPGEARHHGCVRYATDGAWLFGRIEIDERGAALQAVAQRAYADLFEVLAANDCPNLLRVWNYLADINVETGGTERYRQFNAGRQQAFVDAQRSAFDGAPAACALGTARGPLVIQFLAGRSVPVAIENPRQVSAYRYPDVYGERSPTFSRAALADVGAQRTALFVSGTASIVGHETVHAGDVRRQTEESLRNISTLRRLAGERSGREFDAGAMIYTLYLRRAADAAAVREVFEREVGAASRGAREAVYLQADICRADLLVEIEAHGFVNSGDGE
jgi:chorismate lyase / 3-hydroxybenzoate synthase